MRRYWWPESVETNDNSIKLEGETFRHIFKVCRREVGDHFELLNEDKAYLVKVVGLSKNEASVEIESSRVLSPLKKPHIHLVLSFSQPKVVERVLEKSVELGVKSVQLISTQNSFLKGQSKIQSKIERSEKIITQAMQQSGRGELMSLKEPKSLEEFLKAFAESENSQGFMFYEAESKKSPLEGLEGLNTKACEDLYILVGSEGGFTEAEARLVLKSGFHVLSLGEQILRVETACVSSISILKSSFGLW